MLLACKERNCKNAMWYITQTFAICLVSRCFLSLLAMVVRNIHKYFVQFTFSCATQLLVYERSLLTCKMSVLACRLPVTELVTLYRARNWHKVLSPRVPQLLRARNSITFSSLSARRGRNLQYSGLRMKINPHMESGLIKGSPSHQ